MSDAPTAPSPYQVLGVVDFRRYLVSIVAAGLASEIQSVAVGWQIYELTGDPLALGLIGLAGALPFLASVLFAGHLADRFDRRQIALVALIALLGCTTSLAGFSASGLAATHHWLIYGVIMAASLARSVLTPARGALVAEIVRADQFEAATRMRTACFQLGQVCGRSGSGFIYAGGLALGLGAAFSYAVSASLMLISIGAMLTLRHTPAVKLKAGQPVLASLASGIQHVTGQKILFGAMLLDFIGILFGDAIALLPIFAADILQIGPQGMGILRAAPAVGALGVAVWVTHRSPFRHAGQAMLWSMAGFGVSMIGFGLSTSFWLTLALLTVSGGLDYISVLVRGTLVQVLTPRHLLGRVTAVQHLFIGAGNELGAFESGLAARLMGLVPSVVFGGAVTVAATAAIARWNQGLRRLGALHELGK